MHNKRLVFMVALLITGLMAACQTETPAAENIVEAGDLVVREAWVRPAVLEGGNGAAYMLIENTGTTDDQLIGASASFAEAVEVHETFVVDEDDMAGDMEGMEHDMDHDMDHGMEGMGDMMGMRQIPQLVIPAGETVALEVGGYHVMLIGIADPLEPGEMVEVTLVFENAGEVVIPAEVREE